MIFSSLFHDGISILSLPPSGPGGHFFILSFFRFFGLRTLKENEHIPSSESSDVLLKAFWKLLFFFFYLHDFCMGSVTGHQHHVKLIIYPGDVITKYGFTRGMFKTWYMHDGASDWVLEGLVRIHTLQRKTRVTLENFNLQKSPGQLPHSWLRIEKRDSHHWATNTGVAQMMSVTI